MIIDRVKSTVRTAAQAAFVLAVFGLWIGGLIYASVEWLDHSTLDQLRGRPKAEALKVLGQPALVQEYRGLDRGDYERWYYQQTFRASEYVLIFDDSGNLRNWYFYSYD